MKKKPQQHKNHLDQDLDQNLDQDEEALLHSFEEGEWRSVKTLQAEKALAKKTAAKSLHKDVRINIRLASADVAGIKRIAAYEGLPYQTLIASVLHKFAAGHLAF